MSLLLLWPLSQTLFSSAFSCILSKTIIQGEILSATLWSGYVSPALLLSCQLRHLQSPILIIMANQTMRSRQRCQQQVGLNSPENPNDPMTSPQAQAGHLHWRLGSVAGGTQQLKLKSLPGSLQILKGSTLAHKKENTSETMPITNWWLP